MRASILLITTLALSLVGACGGGGGGAASTRTAGPMPPGGTYHGQWQSPQYGNMHICVSGSTVMGDYEKNERSGSLQGTVEGNLLRFTWEERRELVVGRPTVQRGRGYFHLEIGQDGDQYFRGEWGQDDRDSGGGPWNGVKMRNREPTRCLRTSGGSAPSESDSGGGVDWSDDDTDSGGGGGGGSGSDDGLEGFDI